MADDFKDIDLTAFGSGALGGVGADDHFATRTSYVPEGVQFEIVCDTCGQRQHVTVSWDECIFVSQGVPPPGTAHSPPWAYSARHGALYPTIGCCACQRRDTLVLVTPDEATRHLRAGTQAQHLTATYVANGIAQVRSMSRGYNF